MSSATRNPLLKAARNPSRSTAAPTLSTRELTANKPTKGLNTSSIQHPSSYLSDSSSVTFNLNVQAQDPPVQLSTVVDDGPEPPGSHDMDVDVATTFEAPTFDHDPGSLPAATHDTIMQTLVHHRATADVARAQPDPRPTKIRKRRTCAKCARTECSSSQKSSNCRNACQDCKLTNCRGRNAKKPKKKCSTPGLWD